MSKLRKDQRSACKCNVNCKGKPSLGQYCTLAVSRSAKKERKG